MSVNSASANSYWNYAKRIGNIYLHTTFGTGADEFMSSMNKSIFGKKPTNTPWYQPYKGADWSNFWTKFKTAMKDVEAHETAIRKANGGSYWKSFWHQISTMPKLFKDEWKLGGELAKKANKSQFLGKLGGLNKALMKRMPLIGGLIALACQIPNIVSAFTADGKDPNTGQFDPSKAGGLATGTLEIGKTVAKIGLDTAGFMVGQALIPIPLVGGIIGSMVASYIGGEILGKSFSEKVAEANGKKSNIPNWAPYISQTNPNLHFNGANGYNMPQSSYSAEQLHNMRMYLNNINYG